MLLSNQAIKDLKSDFWSYIEVLKEFHITKEKAKINDLYQQEELLREEIINKLKDISAIKN